MRGRGLKHTSKGLENKGDEKMLMVGAYVDVAVKGSNIGAKGFVKKIGDGELVVEQDNGQVRKFPVSGINVKQEARSVHATNIKYVR